MSISKRTILYMFVIFSLVCSLLPISADAVPLPGNPSSSATSSTAPQQLNLATPATSKAGGHKVVVDNNDKTTLTELKQSGATQLVDYDSFSLWRTPDNALNRISKKESVSVQDEMDSISLRDQDINTLNGVDTNVPAGLRQTQSSSFQFWLVQFVGPLKTEWLDKLKSIGIEPVIYMPSNAYVVWLDGNGLAKLEALVGADPVVQWSGAYHPAYRLAPQLQGKLAPTSGLTAVTVQVYNTGATQTTLAKLSAFGGKILRSPENILKFVNVSLEIPADQLANVVSWPDVFNVEPYVTPKKLDEAQGQILAGNLTTISNTVVPSGPGYLTWLASKGFPTDPTKYPVVDVVDDGIDNGTANPLHPDFHVSGQITASSRLIFNANCTSNPTADGQDGHGNINAGIVGGFNNRSGYPYKDTNGYSLGLGISPYGRVAGTKIFANNGGAFDETGCGNSAAGEVASAYNLGANITSNSWGANTNGAYDAEDQSYDALTRDATSAVAGNQQMLHIFAAGNAGNGAGTIGSPGGAKNVLSVGATENVRDNGVLDGCSFSAAGNADNIASFSSRGPTQDLRVKPDVVAPGTHVQGPASQDPTYTGSGVCNKYYPTVVTQTLYTWSTGTSHSTPALAGVTSLLYNYYQRVLAPNQVPSPAMLKALILNSPRYLKGTSAGDTLPSNNQGWGDANMGMLFDGTPRLLLDQTTTFTTTGQFYRSGDAVVDTSKPVRISLVWTDAPGSTTGNAYVNDLDLQVTINGQIYKGNVFSGGTSITGGSFDKRNNVENVFLPAGTTGNFAVRVTAANIAGKADPTLATNNQDFALVIYNAAPSTAPVVGFNSYTFDDANYGGNGNGVAESGESLGLSLNWYNDGTQAATGVSGVLTVTSGNATLQTNSSPYPDIPANGGNAYNTNAYLLKINSTNPCGTPITLTQVLTFNGGNTLTTTITIPTGVPVIATGTSTDVPKAIPDNTPAGIDSSLNFTNTYNIAKITVQINITHTFDSDLIIQLVSPQNVTVTLSNRHGGGGHNYTNTIFDDAATTPISAGSAPFTGTYRPDSALSVLNNHPSNGTWKLHVSDNVGQDVGTILGWSITISTGTYSCAIVASGGTPQSATINTTFAQPLQATYQLPTGPASTVVTFTAPNSGASATFANASNIFTGTTDANGVVNTSALKANGVVGSYVVTATASGVITPAVFHLQNTLPVTTTTPVPTTTTPSPTTTTSTTPTPTTPTPTTTTPTTPVPTTTAPPPPPTYTYYLPFLANVYKPDSASNGSFTTYLAFQNQGNSAATVSLVYVDNQGNPVATPATTCLTVAVYGECIAPNPFTSGNRGAGILTSSQPLNVIVAEGTPFGGSAYAVSAGANAILNAPFAFNKSFGNYSTQLTIFNAATITSSITVNFYDTAGSQPSGSSKTFAVGPKQSYTLDQAAVGSNIPLGFDGWAQIVGASGSQLVAQVLEQNPSSGYVAIANAQATPSSNTKVFAPAIFNQAYGAFVTGADIINPNAVPVTVSVTYYNLSGTPATTTPFTIAPFGLTSIFQGATVSSVSPQAGLPANGLPNGFAGAAVVTSTGGVLMAVNEYGGLTAGGTPQSGTYLAAANGGTAVGLPVIANGGFGYTTGDTIFNTSNQTVTASIQYYNVDGSKQGTATSFSIGANASQGFFQGAPALNLPSDFYGTAVITVTNGPANALIVTTNAVSTNFFYTFTEPNQ